MNGYRKYGNHKGSNVQARIRLAESLSWVRLRRSGSVCGNISCRIRAEVLIRNVLPLLRCICKFPAEFGFRRQPEFLDSSVTGISIPHKLTHPPLARMHLERLILLSLRFAYLACSRLSTQTQQEAPWMKRWLKHWIQ